MFLVSENGNAQNPISHPGVYIDDPSAKVFDNGKLYIYGSTDESETYYCSGKHDIMHTADIQSWEISKNMFASKGENDHVP